MRLNQHFFWWKNLASTLIGGPQNGWVKPGTHHTITKCRCKISVILPTVFWMGNTRSEGQLLCLSSLILYCPFFPLILRQTSHQQVLRKSMGNGDHYQVILRLVCFTFGSSKLFWNRGLFRNNIIWKIQKCTPYTKKNGFNFSYPFRGCSDLNEKNTTHAQ